MSDRELLAAAIKACGASNRGFAIHVLGIVDSSVRRVLAGARRLNGTEKKLCRAIIAHPEVVLFLAEGADVKGER